MKALVDPPFSKMNGGSIPMNSNATKRNNPKCLNGNDYYDDAGYGAHPVLYRTSFTMKSGSDVEFGE